MAIEVQQVNRLERYREIKWLRHGFCRFCGVGDAPATPLRPTPLQRPDWPVNAVVPTQTRQNNDFPGYFLWFFFYLLYRRFWIWITQSLIACRSAFWASANAPPPPRIAHRVENDCLWRCLPRRRRLLPPTQYTPSFNGNIEKTYSIVKNVQLLSLSISLSHTHSLSLSLTVLSALLHNSLLAFSKKSTFLKR